MSDKEDEKTIIFDEIDAGIGGKTADILGSYLDEISKSHQLFCITHLPQIASYAKNHYLIEKYVDGDKTNISVKSLDNNKRVKEIARMLSGEPTEVALRHARELLKKRTERPL
ncbi:MAG: DNA repair protein RecN [Candidatus Cloacimonetes bacterium]|nr:DNA repair protein RecN [Candidatus Cloacimonadota bacterium]